MSETNIKSKIEKELYSSLDKESFYERNEIPYDQGIINIISLLLTNICEENNEKNKNGIDKYFETQVEPSINIKDYITRLFVFSKPEESTIISSLIYIDRFCQNNQIILTKCNIYKLILASFVVAIKYNEDFIYSMDIFSKIGGISSTELKNLELKFLFMIEFDLFIDKELYYNYYNNLKSLNLENEEIEEIEDDNV